MKTDAYGRVLLDAEEIFDAIYRSSNKADLFGGGPEIDQYNNLCVINDKLDFLISTPPVMDHTPDEEHRIRQNHWLIPMEYQSLDIWLS